jgi:hypothetical protein
MCLLGFVWGVIAGSGNFSCIVGRKIPDRLKISQGGYFCPTPRFLSSGDNMASTDWKRNSPKYQPFTVATPQIHCTACMPPHLLNITHPSAPQLKPFRPDVTTNATHKRIFEQCSCLSWCTDYVDQPPNSQEKPSFILHVLCDSGWCRIQNFMILNHVGVLHLPYTICITPYVHNPSELVFSKQGWLFLIVCTADCKFFKAS